MKMKAVHVYCGMAIPLLLLSCGSPKEPVQYFDSEGTQMAFTMAGNGTPVVVLHGFSHSIQEDWVLSGAFDKLAEDYLVIGMDARGHGNSSKPHDPDSYGLEMVHDVARLLDHLEVEQAHVLGYSMGGFMALKMATLYPERVSSIVLGGAGWIDAQWDELGPAWKIQADEFEAKEDADGKNDPLALAAVLTKEYELKVDEAALRKCTVPSLAIMGEEDFLRPGLDSLARVMPHMQVEILPWEDHGSTYSAPAFITLIQGFLAEQVEEF